MANLKVLIGLLAIVAVVLGLFQIAPPIMANYNFQDDIKTIVLMDGTSPQKTDEDIRNDVLRKAREHELPIEAKQGTEQRLNSPCLPGIYVPPDNALPATLPDNSFDQ